MIYDHDALTSRAKRYIYFESSWLLHAIVAIAQVQKATAITPGL